METALSGVRVLDLTLYWAGPYCTMILADLGAEVIRIESSESNGKSESEFSFKGLDATYIGLNRNKQAITLNLKLNEGREIFYELVKASDVVVDNFRVGVLERLGIGYDSLEKINPRIITCSITGFGPTGPYANRPAFDPIACGISGILYLMSDEGMPPKSPNISVADIPCGMFAAHGIMAALYAREKTGKGQKVDTSLLESVIGFINPLVTCHYIAGKRPLNKMVFATKDNYITVEPGRHFKEFCRAVDRDDLAQDPRFTDFTTMRGYKDVLDPIISDIISSKTTEEWLELFIKVGVPCSPVNTLAEGLNDPQVLHRGMVISLEHESGEKVKTAGNPIKMSGTPKEQVQQFSYPPAIGQHTEQVLHKLLGYSGEKIQKLREERVI